MRVPREDRPPAAGAGIAVDASSRFTAAPIADDYSRSGPGRPAARCHLVATPRELAGLARSVAALPGTTQAASPQRNSSRNSRKPATCQLFARSRGARFKSRWGRRRFPGWLTATLRALQTHRWIAHRRHVPCDRSAALLGAEVTAAEHRRQRVDRAADDRVPDACCGYVAAQSTALRESRWPVNRAGFVIHSALNSYPRAGAKSDAWWNRITTALSSVVRIRRNLDVTPA